MFTKSVDFNNILSRINKDIGTSRKVMLHKMANDIEQYVPYDTGVLSSSMVVDDANGIIAFTDAKAGYVYDMPTSNNFNKSHHPKATSNWIQVAKAENISDWVSTIKSSFRKGGK